MQYLTVAAACHGHPFGWWQFWSWPPSRMCMLLHIWTEHQQPRFPTDAMAHRLHVEQCVEARFSFRGLWNKNIRCPGSGTVTGKLTSSIGLLLVTFDLWLLLFLWQSGRGTLLSPSWKLHRSSLPRCPWGGGCSCKGDKVRLLGQGHPCTGHCHRHAGVDQPAALDAAADRPTLFHAEVFFLRRRAASLQLLAPPSQLPSWQPISLLSSC